MVEQLGHLDVLAGPFSSTSPVIIARGSAKSVPLPLPSMSKTAHRIISPCHHVLQSQSVELNLTIDNLILTWTFKKCKEKGELLLAPTNRDKEKHS